MEVIKSKQSLINNNYSKCTLIERIVWNMYYSTNYKSNLFSFDF